MPADTAGNDLRQIVEFSSFYFQKNLSPYFGENYYPPFVSIFFAPLIFFKFGTNYIIITSLSVFLFCLYTIFYALKFSGRKKINAIFLFFIITGFLSYGFQFELERGQFNVIAMFFCISAIFLFHYKPKYRILAYILFTASVQLKIYPVIFIFLLIEDWSLWKENITRIITLAIVNFLLLFILGINIFNDFISNLSHYSSHPAAWIGNHSVSSFLILITQKSVERLGMTELSWTKNYSIYAGIVLILFYLIILFKVIFDSYRKREKGFNIKIFFICMIGALIIPSVSHDYKLCLLVLPAALIYDEINNKITNSKSLALKILIIISSFLYSSLLFAFSNKPILISNNFPNLFLFLIIILSLYYLTGKSKSVESE